MNTTSSRDSVGNKSMSHDHNHHPHHDHSHSHSHSHSHTHDHYHAASGNNNITLSEEDIEEENKHFLSVLRSYKYYRTNSLQALENMRQNFEMLPAHQRNLLPHLQQKLASMRAAVEANYHFIKHIIGPHLDAQSHALLFANTIVNSVRQQNEATSQQQQPAEEEEERESEVNMEKVRSTLRQFVRDWSEEGQAERERCYGLIIEELLKYFPDANNRRNVHVLNPGCGLGRLAFDIAKQGFSSQGNEFSFFMLLASNFILNSVTAMNQFTIYPFVHQTSNVISVSDQLRPVQIPDTLPQALPENSNFSMVAGDFIEVYSAPEYVNSFDSVVTCFFIDTAHNVFEYIEVISAILREGGVWINYGPLLYHYAEMPGEFSIELSYDELRNVIASYGFQFRREEMKASTYTADKKSMLQVMYKCVFFTAVKTARIGTAAPSPVMSTPTPPSQATAIRPQSAQGTQQQQQKSISAKSKKSRKNRK